MASNKTIGRLSLYRRLLRESAAKGEQNLYSHQLAALAGVTPAQVRRDVMTVGYSGSPAHGYDVRALSDSIGGFLDAPEHEGIALVGVGNLGRALLAYFVGRSPKFSIVAAFDNDPGKVNRVIHGCRCYSVEQIPDVVREKDIRMAMISVPASEAQVTATALCSAGVRGLLNFAPVRLWVPEGVYIEDMDVTLTLERVSFFARQRVGQKGLVK